MKYKDTFPELLKHLPLSYAEYIEQIVWDEFVAKWLTLEWEALRKLQQERRAKNTNLHKLSRMGYVGLQQKMEKELSHELIEFDRGDLWTIAWLKENMNKEVKEIIDKIASWLTQIWLWSLTLALGTQEHTRRVRDIGTRVTHTNFFHTPTPYKRPQQVNQQKVIEDW